jgi:hypothetical protein
MSTTLRVDYFHTERMCSSCTVLKSTEPGLYANKQVFVDLTVNGDFGETAESTFVGKTFEVDGFQAYELLGIGVREVTA